MKASCNEIFAITGHKSKSGNLQLTSIYKIQVSFSKTELSINCLLLSPASFTNNTINILKSKFYLVRKLKIQNWFYQINTLSSLLSSDTAGYLV